MEQKIDLDKEMSNEEIQRQERLRKRDSGRQNKKRPFMEKKTKSMADDMYNNINTNTGWNAAANAYMDPDSEIDLLDLAGFLLHHLLIIVICIAIGIGAGLFYHEAILDKSYQADSSIFIVNSDSVLTVSDLQVSSELTVDYQKILESRATLKAVIKDQKLNMNYYQLRNIMTIENDTESHILTIRVTCSDPKLSKNIANSIMNIGIQQIRNVVPGSELTIVDSSEAEDVKEVTMSKSKCLMYGCLAGFVLSVGVLVILYLMDSTLKDEEDVKKWMQIPILASIPYLGKKRTITTEELPFPVTEAFHILCGNIQLSGYKLQVIGVTSAMPNEGKSSVSYHFAKSMAEFGKRVVFLDADMRKSVLGPQLSSILKTRVSTKMLGLSDYLCADIDEEDIVYETKTPGFYVIGAGKVPPNAATLLSGRRFSRLIARLRENYDYIIIDTPPVNVVVDGTFIMNDCDGSVLVLGAGETERKKEEKALQTVRQTNANFLGVVLNKARYTGGHYGYGYKYSYGYSYGHDSKREKTTAKKQKKRR